MILPYRKIRERLAALHLGGIVSSSSPSIRLFTNLLRFATVGLALQAFAACNGKPEIIREETAQHHNSAPDAAIDAYVPILTTDSGHNNTCVAKTCADQGADCGDTVDGCGNVLHCGDCGKGEACSIETANKCTKLSDLCKPISERTACKGKACGIEGDGCGGQFDCGSCKTGEACGGDKPFQCSAVPDNYDDQNCPAKIPSCKSAGARCGVIGNGCGGTIDCTKELGACPAGSICGLKTPYQCDAPPPPTCKPAASCAAMGWACGLAVDSCGTVHDCSKEGRTCGPLAACIGGITGPTQCVASPGTTCPLCSAVPDCTGKPQVTRLSGRVVSPGRTDADTANQVGVPNAFVYILRSDDVAGLPKIATGIPANGTACDRCDTQDLGQVLSGATTDATGAFTIEGDIPVGQEFLLIVKAGKFRRVVKQTLPATAACKTTALSAALPANPTRLPRSMTDGLAVNIPHIAVTTGQIDAMECVFEKMGIAHTEFNNPGATGTNAARLHLYRGGPNTGTPPGAGARIDNTTPHDSVLYSSLPRMQSYDMVVADCEGATWDAGSVERDASGGNVREFVNRGGRLFASHLSFSWLDGNGTQAYAAATPIATGLGPAATWDRTLYTDTSGTGVISVGRPRASARIQNFAAWAAREGIATAPAYQFNIVDPRSTNTGIGTSSEEFVYRSDGNQRVQQFSFNTPYAAPKAAVCGRVAYSGFHVSAGGGTQPYIDAVFPAHCTGALTPQEKVLLYMLFDLGSCVGNTPPPPTCVPVKCTAAVCGVVPNGCGGTVDCGKCPPPGCRPTSCGAQNAECGAIGDGCGALLDCGVCPKGQICGINKPNQCGETHCTPQTCDDAKAECGNIGDGCGALIDCGQCPPGQVCGLESPFKCGTPPCVPKTCADVGAECGSIADGCGNVLDCGNCPPGATCGLREANKCSMTR
jgi:hypothetical protein